VTGLTEDIVGFPVAVATRLIGLQSTGASQLSLSSSDDGGADPARPEPDYAFDGYQVVFSVKVGLTPPSKSDPAPPLAPGVN
jgi:hypothetical protein